MKHLAELAEWQPGADPLNVSHIPLRSRPRIDDAQHRQQRIHCHDMAGGYLDDRFASGCGVEHIYNFYNWQFVDIFIYFSHHRITIPPVGWINAAHRNGVKVLGTFITEWDAGKDDAMFLLDGLPGRGDGERFFADKMIAVAKYYGFDGWFFNIECGLDSPHNAQRMAQLLKYMRKEIKRELGDGALVLWYDTVTSEGDLKWQNQLNDKNEMFLDVSDGMFVNYAWTTDMLRSSHARARGRNYDVYFGIDCWGRGTLGGGQYDCHRALQAIEELQSEAGSTSVAFFAPGWTFEGRHGGGEGFELVERRFWFGGSSSESFLFDLEIEPTFLSAATPAQIRSEGVKEDTWFVENGGSGWKLVQGEGVGPNVMLLGQNVLQASHAWCRRAREFDLVALLQAEIARRGATGIDAQSLLDRWPPIISFGEWYAGGPPNPADQFYLKVELRDGEHRKMAGYDSTILTAAPEWKLATSTLFAFGSGARYLHWEDGGKDVENWAGHFGTKIAGAFLQFKWHPDGKLEGLRVRESIASFLDEREAPCALPFYTNFDQGLGHKLFIEGKLVREGQWSHLNRQSLQPTFRYGQRVAGCRDCIEFSVSQDTAFEGGSSVLVSGLFDCLSSALEEAPYHHARLFKTRIELPADRPTLVSYVTRSETPSAAVDLVIELDDGALVRLCSPARPKVVRPLLEGAEGGARLLLVEPVDADSPNGWDRATYLLQPEVSNGRAVVSLALLSYLAQPPSAPEVLPFAARVGEIRVHSPRTVDDAAPGFPCPPAVCNLAGRASWTIASVNPQLLNVQQPENKDEGGEDREDEAIERQLASVWLTWDRPSEEVECCDVYFKGQYVGRSFAEGHFIENLLYEPTRVSGDESQAQAREVVGEFAVLSVSRVGVRQRMEDAARVVVQW